MKFSYTALNRALAGEAGSIASASCDIDKNLAARQLSWLRDLDNPRQSIEKEGGDTFRPLFGATVASPAKTRTTTKQPATATATKDKATVSATAAGGKGPSFSPT